MNIRSKWSSLREYLTPVNHESNFRKTGEISPEEFVVAGDYLVSKFPTWEWGSGPQSLHKKFLPAEKQFLVTRHVPSYKRYASFLPDSDESADSGLPKSGEEGSSDTGNTEDDVGSDTEWIPSFGTGKSAEGGHVTSTEIDDLDALIEDNAEDDLDYEEDFQNIVQGDPHLRRYDLYIAYSTSYRVPKLYLVGFDGNGIPLLPPQMYEDISGDHKDKTATIEPLPMAHNTTSVSIHPCKHSSVMKVFMEHARVKRGKKEADLEGVSSKLGGLDLSASANTETGEGYVDTDSVSEEAGIRVDQYLVIFLKFIASVTPGIEYDFTMDAL